MKKPSIRLRTVARCASGLALAAVLVAGIPRPAAAQAQQDSLIERALKSRERGSDKAPLTVYEVADFQCPFCEEFTRMVEPKLDSAYVATGKVKWVFVNLPLHTHRLGWAAAEAAMCAGGVAGAFWPMHDLLYANQATWSSQDDPMPLFETYAKKAGVALGPFRDCVLRDRVATLLLQDVTAVVGAHISATPTFIVIKGKDVLQRLVGVKSFSEWQQVLDQALK